MRISSEKGFSLVELLVVVVIIGIVAALAVPAFQRGITAAENRSVFATMRSMSSTQALFFSQNQRFANLAELNQITPFGKLGGSQLFRNEFTFEMTPPTPSNAELGENYRIAAFRTVHGKTYRFEITTHGITQILPFAGDPER